jgi:hypothetical protein
METASVIKFGRASFIKFKDWENAKHNSVEEDASGEFIDKETSSDKNTENAALIAQLNDVIMQRKQAIRDKHDYTAQILEIDAKLLKLAIEKNDLTKKKNDLEAAKEIAMINRKEGKTNVKENY